MESVKWCSMDEIALHLGFGRDTILKLIKEEGMPASKIGGKWRFDIQEIDAWVKKSSARKDNR